MLSASTTIIYKLGLKSQIIPSIYKTFTVVMWTRQLPK